MTRASVTRGNVTRGAAGQEPGDAPAGGAARGVGGEVPVADWLQAAHLPLQLLHAGVPRPAPPGQPHPGHTHPGQDTQENRRWGKMSKHSKNLLRYYYES